MVTQWLDAERWAVAEKSTAELIARIMPTRESEESRRAVIDYVERLIMGCFSCQVFTFGSVALKTYLPDDAIEVSAFSNSEELKDTCAITVRDALEHEEKSGNAEFRVREVEYIQAEVKIIKCCVENIVVHISFNQVGGLCALLVLEEMDTLINRNHLFKRSIILIKAWCYYESRILGAHRGLITTYALETLVLYIFHVFNNSFAGPLEVLYQFLEFVSNFDWEKFYVSLRGPVPISSLPGMAAEPARVDGLLSKSFLDACSTAYAVGPPSAQENHVQLFVSEHFNVVDPLRTNISLGRSVSEGTFCRIHSAFALGLQRLSRLSECPKHVLADEVKNFFTNTWRRHGSGNRPDATAQSLVHQPMNVVPVEVPNSHRSTTIHRKEVENPTSCIEHGSLIEGGQDYCSPSQSKSTVPSALETSLDSTEDQGTEYIKLQQDNAQHKDGNHMDLSWVSTTFLEFLRGFKEGTSDVPFFEGQVKAMQHCCSSNLNVPYKFLEQKEKELAEAIRDNYQRVHDDLKHSAVQYLVEKNFMENMEKISEKLALNICCMPLRKSYQSFPEFIGGSDLVETFALYSGEKVITLSSIGRKLARRLLKFILKIHKGGHCWQGDWDVCDIQVRKNGSIFLITKKATKPITKGGMSKDLEKYIQVLVRYCHSEDTEGRLAFFDEFQEDIKKAPNPMSDKFELFQKYLGAHMAFMPPLARSDLICNLFRVYDSLSKEKGRSGYGPLVNKRGLPEWREIAKGSEPYVSVYRYKQRNDGTESYQHSYWHLLMFLRNFINHVLNYTKVDGVQQIPNLTVVNLMISHELGEFITKLIWFIMCQCKMDGPFLCTWISFERSDDDLEEGDEENGGL